MWINTPSARLAVSNRRALRLNAARGASLRAVQGTLWITMDNDPRDIVLDPGEAFVVDSDRPLVVLALGDCATLDLKSGPSAASRSTQAARSWLGALWRREPVAQLGLRTGALAS
jgi:Protein of unknown function (DUF2917)